MTACDPLELEILPPYIGSAVSPTVDITETTDDITVTITDFRGEHSYSVDKTDQAIADAEQAATNANNAATQATATANAAAQYARQTADQAAADAQETADAAAARADAAAGGANQAAQAATTAAGTANTAASNADAKAALADTAATNADTATQAANTAATNATNAAQSANNAADVAIEAAETITDGYFPHMLAGAAESLMDETDTATFAERVSTHDGVARIESILGNTVVSDGSLLNVNMEGVRTVGFNQIPGWELGTINYTSGALEDSATMCRTVDFIPILAEQTYCLSNPLQHTIGLRFYDNDKVYIGPVALSRTINTFIPKNTFPNARYIKLVDTQATSGGEICFNLSWSGYRNGEYEPYWTQTREIDTAAYFPNGMKSAGSVYDELTATKAVKRVGVVDLGTLTWTASSSITGGFYSDSQTDVKSVANATDAKNAICSTYTAVKGNSVTTTDKSICAGYNNSNRIYVKDEAYAGQSAATFKSAMSGVILHYELATPTTQTIDPPLNLTYPVEAGGTESIVIPTGEQSAAPTMAIVYGLTADGVVDKALSVIAPIEGATASTNYSVNAYLVHDQQLYRVTSAIATGEAITPGSNCVACTVMGEVIRLTA